MRVAVYYSNNDVRLEERPKPQIGPGEILVKMRACGICGSDVMEWYRLKKAPLVLGHEAAGEVINTGEGVKNFKEGDRVFVSHHVPCNQCRYCRAGHHTVCPTLQTTNFDPGGFAEYIRVPAINVERGTFLLPPEISFEEATFIEPLACVVRGQRMANLEFGQHLLILGGGVSGLLHLLLARSRGAERIVVTDINEYRLKAAKELGADLVIPAKEDVPGYLKDRPADLVIICTSATAAFEQALTSVDRAGTILCFAPTEPGVTLPLPVNDFWRNSIKIMHSYGGSPQDITAAIELQARKEVVVSSMITHRLNLSRAGEGFGLVAEGKNSLKVIIKPDAS